MGGGAGDRAAKGALVGGCWALTFARWVFCSRKSASQLAREPIEPDAETDTGLDGAVESGETGPDHWPADASDQDWGLPGQTEDGSPLTVLISLSSSLSSSN